MMNLRLHAGRLARIAVIEGWKDPCGLMPWNPSEQAAEGA